MASELRSLFSGRANRRDRMGRNSG
jgi:hypothetical protein